MLKPVMLGLALVASGCVLAEEELGLSGNVDVGCGASSGNSETESLNFMAKAAYQTVNYLNAVELQALTASQDGVTSRERYLASYQLNRDVTENTSAFGRFEYDNDRFSGFDYQHASTAGLSVNWLLPEHHTLTTEVGAGYRFSKLNSGREEEESIFRLAGQYDWQMTKTTLFTQKLSSDIGEETTISRSVTSLSVAISEAIALKITQQFKYYSDPAPNSTSSDRDTTVSVTYVY